MYRIRGRPLPYWRRAERQALEETVRLAQHATDHECLAAALLWLVGCSPCLSHRFLRNSPFFRVCAGRCQTFEILRGKTQRAQSKYGSGYWAPCRRVRPRPETCLRGRCGWWAPPASESWKGSSCAGAYSGPRNWACPTCRCVRLRPGAAPQSAEGAGSAP